jgi:VCBS repeat-containing protein
MQKSKKARTLARNTNRRNFLRIERLEDRMVLTGAAPIAVNDSFHMLPDQTLEISAPGILANDTDAEGDALSAALFTGPAHGSLTLDPAGSFQYTPEAGFAGIDSFMYVAADDTGHSLLAAVTLRVGNGSSPVSQDDSFTMNEDEVLTIPGPAGILHNDSDADGDPMTAALVTGPANGNVTLATDGSFVYTPAANFHGSDSFVYQASDGTSSGNLATVSITVNSVNDKPVAANDVFTLDEDNSLEISGPGVMANDPDADGDPLTATLVSGPVHGSFTLGLDGSFAYTPAANFHGVDGFSYLVSDGTSLSSVATVTLEVNSVNDVPVAANDEYTTNEDTPMNIDAVAGVIGNDTDADGDPLTASLVSGPTHGTLTLNADGSFNYIPEANFNGVDGFSYVVSDGTTQSDVASVTLNVCPVNDAPVAVNDEFTIDEDTSLTLPAPGVLGNDSDVEGDALSASLVSGPSHGTLSLAADGSLTYTPEANFNGTDSFTYMVSDGAAESQEATVTINVASVDDPPLAANDEYTTDEDTPLSIDATAGLLANDSDPDSSSLTATLVSGPVHGTIALNADGSFSYTPSADFNGVDGFSYVVSDGALESDVATVTLNVNSVADAPVAVNDAFTTDEDTPLVVDLAGSVLANDSDVDGDSLTAALMTGPAHGTLTLNADGSFNYAPEANFNGEDSFVYTASDGSLASNQATVTITVNPVNDAPTAAADEFSTDEDTSLHVDASGVLSNDSDPEGDTLTAALVSGPANGTLTLNADGSFDYVPGANFNGDDSFVYTASDGSLASNEATVTITVNSANDAPVAAADEFSTDEDTSLHVDPAGILGNDSDPDGDTLTAALVSGPANGTLTLNADGSFDYAPAADFNGDDAFVYTASDGVAASAETTVTIHVQAVNDAPVAAADSFTTDEDTPLTVSAPGVLANDSDVDVDALTAVLMNGPAHGTVSLAADGSLTYTPEANFNGSDSFTYQASDGTLTSGETTVSIIVNSVTDAPSPHNDAYSTGEDVTLTASTEMGVLANDFDPQDLPLTAELVSGPSNGTLTLNSDGSFSYTPAANYHGTDSFTYVANNGVEAGPVMTATIVVQPLNDAPVAVNDDMDVGVSGSTSVDASAGVLANDTDVDGDTLTATLLWGPSHGTLTLNSDGSFSYAATAGYSGTDSFKYQANDGMANSNVATVTLHIASQGQILAPVSLDDTYWADAGTSLTVDAPGVLENDTGAEADPLAAALENGPSHGTLTLNADGSFTYTPDDGFLGTDTFTYTASDGTTMGNVATATIFVGDPDPTHNPVAKDDGYVVDAETLLSIPADQGVLANDTDPDGNPLTAVLVAGTAHGTLTLNPDGSFDYQPAIGFTGTDSFTYQASDGTNVSDVAVVDVMVGSLANHRPLAVNDRFTTTVDQPLSVAAPGLLGNDSDPDGDPQTAELFSGPQNGTLVLNPDGSFVYTPAGGFQGRDSFIYRTFDGEVHSALAAVTLYVNPAPSVFGIVQGGSESPHTCLLGGAIQSVLHHLELARQGIDEELLGSLAEDQGSGNLNPWLHDGRWL